jgi:hypothetical protein
MLNYSIERKSQFITEAYEQEKQENIKKELEIENLTRLNLTEKNLIKEFNNMTLNKTYDSENKENNSTAFNTSQKINRNYYNTILNIERLKRIERKANIRLLFDKLDN